MLKYNLVHRHTDILVALTASRMVHRTLLYGYFYLYLLLHALGLKVKSTCQWWIWHLLCNHNGPEKRCNFMMHFCMSFHMQRFVFIQLKQWHCLPLWLCNHQCERTIFTCRASPNRHQIGIKFEHQIQLSSFIIYVKISDFHFSCYSTGTSTGQCANIWIYGN